jgi:hypothetical protein
MNLDIHDCQPSDLSIETNLSAVNAFIRDRLPLMIRKSVLLLSVLASASIARAQFSVYGAATVDHMSGIQSSPVLNTLAPAPCTPYNNTVDPIGVTGGISYEFKTLGPATLSFDVRGSHTSSHKGAQADAEGTGTHLWSALGGLKANFKTPKQYLLPYAQLSAGYARSNFGVLTDASVYPTASPTYPGIATQNALEYHVYAGVDLKLSSFLDFRAAELGFGALQSFGTYGHSYPVLSVSTGVVFHIPPRL